MSDSKRIFAKLLAEQGSCKCGILKVNTVIEINPTNKAAFKVHPKEGFNTSLKSNHVVFTNPLQIKKAKRLFDAATEYNHAIYE